MTLRRLGRPPRQEDSVERPCGLQTEFETLVHAPKRVENTIDTSDTAKIEREADRVEESTTPPTPVIYETV
ncbi:MAG: hypothetical protein ABI696_14685, partial [Rubrivivax sp.]